MKRRKHDFLLGLTVIVFLVIFLGTILFLVPKLRVATRPVVVHFSHEEGLAPLKHGSLVLLSGAIEVGHVTRAEPVEIDRRTIVVVEAQVDQSLPLYDDCEITTDMPLVGGTGTLVVANVGRSGVPVRPDQPIRGRPPQGMAAFGTLSRRLLAEGGLVDRVDRMLDPDAEGSLLNKVMLSVSHVNAMTAELRVQLTEQEQRTLLAKIHRMLDDLNATTAAVRDQVRPDHGASLVAKLHAALDVVHQDLSEVLGILTENRAPLRNTLTSVAHAARTVDEQMIAQWRAEFDPTDPGSLLSKLHVGMDRLNAALADVQVVSDTGRRVLVLNRPHIEQILANMKEMSADLRDGTKEIRLNPSRLLWGPGGPQKDKLAVLTAARDFAQAATYLDDAAARLQAILELLPADQRVPESDQDIREIYDSLRNAFEQFRRAEAFFWEQMK